MKKTKFEFDFLFRCIALVLIGSFYFAGCAGTKDAAIQEQEPDKPPGSGIVEDFDPLSLEDIDFDVKPKLNDQGEASEAYRYLASNNKDSLAAEGSENRKLPGYRVQIGSVTIQEDADEIQRAALIEFEETDVYLIFEAPYYKIRVGDFEIRRDAEALQQKAVDLGYSDAWIVRTVITRKRKSPSDFEQ